MSPHDVESSDSRVVAVVGPTAAGKSDVAMGLARYWDGEIVNADAFQFYRGMDIGTAKPSPDERAEIPHHCLDFLDIAEPASLAQFQQRARTAIEDIQRRGRVPIVVGGSALYLRATCDELDIPPSDPVVRARISAEAQRVGSTAMYERLRAADPAAAEHIDPRNLRRVVRALEVVELTGSFRSRLPEPRSWRPTLWLAPQWSRPELDERIAVRTQRMWAGGLLDEVAGLLARGLAAAPTAAKAVGYPQAMAHLAGDMTRDQAVADTMAATRKLARRQERTFRGDPRVVTLPGTDALRAAAEAVAVWLA